MRRITGDRRAVNADFTGGTIDDFIAGGKLLFVRFVDRQPLLRLHCLMFGDIRVNRTRPGKRLTLRLTLAPRKDGPPLTPRLVSRGNGRATPANRPDRIDLYLGAARPATPDEFAALDQHRRGDAMNPAYDGAAVLAEAAADGPTRPLADVLLDQTYFPGLGNKIKTEAPWLARLHPLTPVGSLSSTQRNDLATHILDLSQLWLRVVEEQGDHAYPTPHVFRAKTCPRCNSPVQHDTLGDPPRKSHWCPTCQPAPHPA